VSLRPSLPRRAGVWLVCPLPAPVPSWGGGGRSKSAEVERFEPGRRVIPIPDIGRVSVASLTRSHVAPSTLPPSDGFRRSRPGVRRLLNTNCPLHYRRCNDKCSITTNHYSMSFINSTERYTYHHSIPIYNTTKQHSDDRHLAAVRHCTPYVELPPFGRSQHDKVISDECGIFYISSSPSKGSIIPQLLLWETDLY